MKIENECETVAPMRQAELLLLDNICPHEDTRPYGKVTASSRAFWLDSIDGTEASVELTRSGLMDGAFELATSARINFGLPLRERARKQPSQSRTSGRGVARVSIRGSRRASRSRTIPRSQHP